eukprot:TRINITY_DN1551_c0_g2_i1.p1 TRINITY_DN1551_c0_g2~~TRINITY_DN1551_c0_g2_i1.p1  ORF type:complete len:119 (+),score=17.40 TRINITY_DN1551_c0_g2_i1:249-605(+)
MTSMKRLLPSMVDLSMASAAVADSFDANTTSQAPLLTHLTFTISPKLAKWALNCSSVVPKSMPRTKILPEPGGSDSLFPPPPLPLPPHFLPPPLPEKSVWITFRAPFAARFATCGHVV